MLLSFYLLLVIKPMNIAFLSETTVSFSPFLAISSDCAVAALAFRQVERQERIAPVAAFVYR
jgi:hypothetical protein